MPSYYEYYYDQELWCGMLAEHQRYHFDTSRICDYFRKPVYRRSADV